MKTLNTYLCGFALSLALTLGAFWLVQEHLLTDHIFPSHAIAISILVMFALAQLLVQLVLFLGVNQESGPRWNLAALSFALIIVCILVGGTLWIMRNLSHGQIVSGEPFEEGVISPETER